ncbi:unnamed protein product, partial [Allacma fusca]
VPFYRLWFCSSNCLCSVLSRGTGTV